MVGLGRAASLQHFTFRLADGRELHLHTEVPWRLTDGTRINAGRADYWRPATAETPQNAVDEGNIGATLRDVRNQALRDELDRTEIVVTSAAADPLGGAVLSFSNGLRLEIFPDASPAEHDSWEFWRLFERNQPHFVMSSEGAESHT